MSKDISYLLNSWGFAKDTPISLQEHAVSCLNCSTLKVGEIVVALKLASSSQVEKLLEAKPSNILTLEQLAQSIPSIREHSLKILAISRTIPYLTLIQETWAAEGHAVLTPASKAALDELNAVFIYTPDKKPLVVFSDLNGLLQFTQTGSLARLQDPIRLAIGEEPVVALAPPTVVTKASKFDNQATLQVLTASTQDNYWSPAQAKTDAERILVRIFDEALNKKATDIEIAPLRDGTARLRFRMYGDMITPDRHSVLSPEQTREITNFLVSRSRAGDGGRLRKPADGQITYKNSSVETFMRCSFIPADRFGLDFDMISSSVRLMPRTSRNISLKELNLNDIIVQEIRKSLVKSQGLIVLAGPTNSGKSTTIAGVVGEHLKMFGNTKKRLSLEDPVERYLDGITQISVEGNFAELVRALLRHDPDMIWIGEIRDAFSAGACVRSATSGHVVLSTVHANNSILAFRAITNYLKKDTGESSGGGASMFDLAESISLLIGQRLVKRLCPHCRVKSTLTKEQSVLVTNYLTSEGQAHLVEKTMDVLSKGFFKAKHKGCSHCGESGYIGEIPVAEVLPASREVKELFAKSESKLDFNAISKHRLITLSESALELIARGETELTSIFI